MLQKINDKLYYTKHRYSYLEPAIGYIKGDKYAIMIDSGNSKEQVTKFFSELKENNLVEPSYVIFTHHHWDHTFGAGFHSIPIISNFKTKQYLSEMKYWSWDEQSINERIEQKIETQYSADIMKKIYPNLENINIRIPNITKLADFSLNLGNLIVHFYNVENSHSDDALLIYVKDEKVLFIGDSHSKSYNTVPMSFNKIKLYNYINYLKNIDFLIAIPGHGNIMSKDELLCNLKKEYSKL